MQQGAVAKHGAAPSNVAVLVWTGRDLPCQSSARRNRSKLEVPQRRQLASIEPMQEPRDSSASISLAPSCAALHLSRNADFGRRT
eukprot:2220285-Pleurochrysis_carterae.AAC.1